MKSKIFISALLLSAGAALAQKPVKGDRQLAVGANLTSSFATITYKKYVKDNMVNRVRIYGSLDYTLPDTEEKNGRKVESNRNAFSFGLSAGKQKTFLLENEKFEPFVGIDCFVSYSQLDMSTKTSITDSAKYYESINSPVFRQTTIGESINNNQAFNIGFSPYVGFNYYLTQNFALGAEVGTSLFSVEYRKNDSVQKIYNNSGISTSENLPKDNISTRLSLNPYYQITASFWFN